MTDENFLAKMHGKSSSPDGAGLRDADPLAVALRIDDLRSAYCEQLERCISQQGLGIDLVRQLLGREAPRPTHLKPIPSKTSHQLRVDLSPDRARFVSW